jgi:hypothetical protein
MRTFRERLRGLELDIVSKPVYNAGNGLSVSLDGRLPYSAVTGHSHISKTHKGRYPSTLLTQECVKRTQTRLRPVAGLRRLLTRLRKQILNSIIMRKLNGLKEKQYGKN